VRSLTKKNDSAIDPALCEGRQTRVTGRKPLWRGGGCVLGTRFCRILMVGGCTYEETLGQQPDMRDIPLVTSYTAVHAGLLVLGPDPERRRRRLNPVAQPRQGWQGGDPRPTPRPPSPERRHDSLPLAVLPSNADWPTIALSRAPILRASRACEWYGRLTHEAADAGNSGLVFLPEPRAQGCVGGLVVFCSIPV